MKYIKTEVPISIDNIKEYFKDKEIFFLLDYNKSKLQDKIFLTYLSNLDMPCDIDLQEKIEKEKLFELLKSYMVVKSVNSISFLNMAMCQIILKCVGCDHNLIFSNSILTDEQCEEFIDANKEELAKWIFFLDSTMVFLLKTFEDLNALLKVEDSFKVIDDDNFIGLNVVNLFSIPSFLEIYFSANREVSLAYFKPQFENHMFKGKSLYQYYVNDTNLFVPLLTKLINKQLPMNSNDYFQSEEK